MVFIRLPPVTELVEEKRLAAHKSRVNTPACLPLAESRLPTIRAMAPCCRRRNAHLHVTTFIDMLVITTMLSTECVQRKKRPRMPIARHVLSPRKYYAAHTRTYVDDESVNAYAR